MATENSIETSPYECVFTEAPIVVDGLLNEPAWESARPLSFTVPATHEIPVSKTEAGILWDREFLYVGFKAYDRDIYGYYTARDSATCNEDVLEIFIKTSPEREPYYNFEINALGAVYDAYNVRRSAAGSDHRWSRWDCRGLKVGVHIEGTLNNWEDEDEYWQLEAAIPFADLPDLRGRAPARGDEWLFHLARYDYSVYLPDGVELSSCARLSRVDFHRFEDWSTLRFVE